MNAGIFVFVVLAVIAVVFLIYTETPSGKKCIEYGNVSSNIHSGHYSSRSFFNMAQNQIR